MKMQKTLICLLLIVLTTSTVGLALAEEQTTPLPPNIRFGLGTIDVDIRPVKERLQELGYYDGSIDYEMDNDTIYALKLFCDDNQIEYSAFGITQNAFYALTSNQIFTSIITPSPVPEDAEIYETISFGTVSESVLNIQIRLKELGYYEGQQLTPNTYDWGLQAALDTFCKENNISMADMEVTPSLQKIIFSDIAFVRQETQNVSISPTPARPEGYRYVLGESSIEIRRLQDKLTELGYYKQEEYGYELNMDTLYSFNLFCYENRIHYSEQGITEETWNLIMGEQELVSITPMPTTVSAELTEYELIEDGASGEAVSRLQLRLIELGYANNTQLDLGLYDKQLQEVILLFCDSNHIAYSGPGISADIQRAIFSENVAEYSAEANKVALVESVRAFLLTSHVILGLNVSGYALALAGVGVAALFVVLVVLLVTSKPKNATEDSSSASLQGFSKPRTEVSIHTENQMKLIDFNIRYQGKEHKERIRFSEQLEIGRSPGCDLVLADDDKGISRCHCALHMRGGSMVLSDVSVNGTFINDRRYHKTECVVHSGDRIQIGRHLLVIKF